MSFRIALSVGLGLLAAIGAAGQIEPELERRLAADEPPGGKFAVCFVMREQAWAAELDPGIPKLPKPERRARVGRVLMDFAAASQADLRAYLEARQMEGDVEDVHPLWIVNAIGCWATRDVILDAARRSDVELVYYDRVPCESDGEELVTPPAPTDGIPQHMIVTNVRGAWNQGYHGEGVVLGVIDTGVRYTHEDLRRHLWTSPAYPNCGFNFASNQYSSGHPGPSTYDTLTPLDYYGHGTHCAGTATADGTYGNGVHDTFGIAPATRIMSLPVDVYLHSPYPDTSMENNMLAAMQFCIRPPRDTLNGADVITMSLGLVSGWQPRLACYRVVEQNLLSAGIVHVVTAGSEGPNPRSIRCPGNCPPPWRNPVNHPTGSGHEGDTGTTAVITVGTTDNEDRVASFSARGPTDVWGSVAPYNDYEYPPGLTDPDVMMPGINILSTYYLSDQAYTTMSGTSMSAPGAAGVVCLMLSKNPELTPCEVDSILELHAVRDLGDPGKDNVYGAGRINCSLAVAFTPLPVVAVEERPVSLKQSLPFVPVIARGVLHVAASGILLDIAGHRVRTLQAGANDAGGLAPGVYFVAERPGTGIVARVVVLK